MASNVPAIGGLLAALLLSAHPASGQIRPSDTCPAVERPSGEEPRLRDVQVTVYNTARMPQADVDLLFEVTNRVWAPYGVRLRPGAAQGGVTVVLSQRRLMPSAEMGPLVLGTTLFSGGHATPYINLSRAAAEAFAEDTDEDGLAFSARPTNQRNTILAHIMGVALAHEMAHYLLDTAAHSSTGLLRPSLRMPTLAFPQIARLTLTPEQQRRLCGALQTLDARRPAMCPSPARHEEEGTSGD